MEGWGGEGGRKITYEADIGVLEENGVIGLGGF